MKKFTPLRIKNRFFHPPELSDHKPESLLFGTLPSFLRACAARLFHTKNRSEEWIGTYLKCEQSDQMRITWVGHATFLIQTNGINILTDPVFGNVSPLFRRWLAPGIAPDQLPRIDYVLLSHNHRDHMCASSLRTLKKQNPDLQFLVPQGDKAWFDRRNLSGAQEFEWWQEVMIPEIRFVFLPAVHWSQRGFFDKNRSLWGSWMIEGSERVYFAGDTAYGPHFKHIAHHFESIAVALMPIGPCEPAGWMKKTHVSGEHAIQALYDLNAAHGIAMHWGTFPFGADQFDLPIQKLRAYMQEGMPITVLKVGETFSVDGENEPQKTKK